ncbi:mitochondrial inner membrane protein Mpv17-like [Tubulanus polymorphus]|uniref:mitochondrial inner membrane protein Mpv17-like n=1 Tax=Tubulanus polymorphus TaxID=672921 RepID=UPI003DA2EA78
MRLLRLYLNLLDKHPWKTQSFTVGSLMCVGDAIAQFGVERRQMADFDFKRSGRFLLFGACLAGPVIRKWYVTLDKLFPGTTKVTAFKKMAADQIFFAPTFLFGFLTIMSAGQGKSSLEIQEKINQDYFQMLLNSYKVWPATQLLNFYFVPLQHRIFVVQMVALGWNAYLAWASEKQVTKIDEIADEQIINDSCSTCAS